jgi:hypothetical protein
MRIQTLISENHELKAANKILESYKVQYYETKKLYDELKEKRYDELKDQYDKLSERRDAFEEKLLEKATSKTDIIINTLAPLNLTNEKIDDLVDNFTLEHVDEGQIGVSEQVINYCLVDDEKYAYGISDAGRLTGVYIDKHGQVKKDPDMKYLITHAVLPIITKTRRLMKPEPIYPGNTPNKRWTGFREIINIQHHNSRNFRKGIANRVPKL